jgi:ABC-type molybdenum transport system ATPase subunit/photorepair protein PhrA
VEQPRKLTLGEHFYGLDRRSRRSVIDLDGTVTCSSMQVIMVTHSIDEIPYEISQVI